MDNCDACCSRYLSLVEAVLLFAPRPLFVTNEKDDYWIVLGRINQFLIFPGVNCCLPACARHRGLFPQTYTSLSLSRPNLIFNFNDYAARLSLALVFFDFND